MVVTKTVVTKTVVTKMAAPAHPGSPFQVRVATAADIAGIIPIVNAAFAIETFLDGTRTDEARMAEMMADGTFLVAEDDRGQIVASVYIELRGERGYFGMLAVDPARQGGGLGKSMTGAAEDHCRRHGCTHMDLTVLTLRPELPPLYRKLGYVETGREAFRPPRTLKAGAQCQCIIMSKEL
jgi:GNAT superfamily N-acetyltransferase